MNTQKLQMNILETILILLLILFIGSFTTAWASTTYYVDNNNSKASDSNTGTQSSPWKTIGKASAMMVAGDTAIVLAGTYNESVNSTRSGASGSKITFKASGVVNVSSGNIDHNYITIDGFNLTNGSIDITAGNYCEVLNNNLSPGYIAMHFLNSPDTPTGCLIKGNRLNSIKNPSGDYVVIQIFGSKHIVDGNEIGPASDIDAFRFWGHDNIIRNNYVHDITYSPGSAAHMDGFQTFSLNGWNSYNIIFENNRLINSQGQMFMTEQFGEPSTHDIIVRNNVYANVQQNGFIGIPNMSFLNNTFYKTGSMIGYYKNANMNSTGAIFKNNIFVGTWGYGDNDYSGLMQNSSGSLTIPWAVENNFFSTVSGAKLLNFDNQPGGINGGAINFTNAAAYDFSIKTGSVVIDKGLTLSGFNYDLIGTTRPQGAAWDIGAYENTTGTTGTLLPPGSLRVQ